MSLIVRPEAITDHADIGQVNRLAFGREDEGRLVVALRDGGHARLSLVAALDGQIIGHILFSRLAIVAESGVVPALALAPMAVIPSQQRRRIGSTLVNEGLAACRDAGDRIVIVLGHPDFYRRFGFSAKRAERLRSEYSGEAFMAAELVPGASDGIEGEVRYSPPFGTISD